MTIWRDQALSHSKVDGIVPDIHSSFYLVDPHEYTVETGRGGTRKGSWGTQKRTADPRRARI
jgi:hypothetical protein